MNQLMRASLSRTHYRHEVGMLKVPYNKYTTTTLLVPSQYSLCESEEKKVFGDRGNQLSA